MTPAWRPTATLAALRERARLLDLTRVFFAERGLLEVEVPPLQGGANLDRGVVPQPVDLSEGRRWLITSPEHPLKRLLAAGYGEVWACCPCVRPGERGRHHAPAFSMIEWYRLGIDHHALAAETVELLRRLTGLGGGVVTLSYRDAFRQAIGLDPASASDEALAACLEPGDAAAAGSRSDLLDLVLSLHVQPAFDPEVWTVVVDWPSDQAAQARVTATVEGPCAARFECYRGRLELANGYHECGDADELATRLADEQQAAGRAPVTRDHRFEAAMAHGLPDCAGVALGFDRAVMLALGIDDIAAVQAFGWERA